MGAEVGEEVAGEVGGGGGGGGVGWGVGGGVVEEGWSLGVGIRSQASGLLFLDELLDAFFRGRCSLICLSSWAYSSYLGSAKAGRTLNIW